jgi:hypothetical protein
VPPSLNIADALDMTKHLMVAASNLAAEMNAKLSISALPCENAPFIQGNAKAIRCCPVCCPEPFSAERMFR